MEASMGCASTWGQCAGVTSLMCICSQLRYANNSNYKNDTIIRKECFVGQAVLDELKRIIEESEVIHFGRSAWHLVHIVPSVYPAYAPYNFMCTSTSSISTKCFLLSLPAL